jgi:hypothetical protein
MHWLCYGLHAILLALHVILILLLINHPEHDVTIASDNPWVTTTLTVSLQAFYVVNHLLQLLQLKISIMSFNSAIYCWAGIHYTATSHISCYCPKTLFDSSA